MPGILNKLVGVMMLALILSACGGASKAVDRSKTRTRSSSSSKGKNNPTKKKKDVKVIDWKEGKDDKKPPITEKVGGTNGSSGVMGEKVSIEKEDLYDVTYFIPFDAGSYTNTTNSSDRFIQYYSGLQVAADILENEGVNLRIKVVDEKERKFESVLTESVSNSTDVIVGPYSRLALRIAAEYAKKNELPLVSPWQASSKITKENPYYIQLRPNLDEHYYSIFEDIKKNYDDLSSVYLIGSMTSTKDSKRINKLQRMAMDVWGENEENHLQEFMAIPDSIDLGETAFDSIFVEDQTNVIIIPNWSFEDEAFIYGALRRLSVEKGLADVVVYGMPIMLESEKINFDYYNSLNMKVARSKYVDERDNDVLRFKRDFVNRYGALPTDDAYEGYDNLMYIGRNLYQYGKNFQFYLEEDQGYYLQAGYKVQPISEDSVDDGNRKINYFENKNVDIIEFKDNIFVRNLDD